MSLTYRRKGFQWFGKRITESQMERAILLKKKLNKPITQMAQEAFDAYLTEQEMILQQIAEYEANERSHANS